MVFGLSMTPIPARSQEALILEYIKLRYLRAIGKISKIYLHIEQKANELGMGRGPAWHIIAHARKIGMIERAFIFI